MVHNNVKPARQKSGGDPAGDPFIATPPADVKKGQCIRAYHDTIGEAMDLLLATRVRDLEEAKVKAVQQKRYCIVMEDATPVDEEGSAFEVEAMYCTASNLSAFHKEITVPLPHSSKEYKEDECIHKPLELTKGSPEFESQFYVIPYKKFVLTYGANAKVPVNTRSAAFSLKNY